MGNHQRVLNILRSLKDHFRPVFHIVWKIDQRTGKKWSQRGLCSYVTYRAVGQDLPINHTWEMKKGKESKVKPELLSAAPGRTAFTGREGGWTGYT